MRLRSHRIVCPDGTLDGEVVVEEGRIASVGAAASHDDKLLELGERWLVPGYIDMHVHGGAGAQCNTSREEEVAEVAGFHGRHGTTGLLATIAAAPVDELRSALTAINRCTAPNVLGAHLEGPFLNPDHPGAMDPEQFLDPDLGLLENLLQAGPVRLMTLAPELPGALELIQRLQRERILASIGHTAASEEQVQAAVGAGAIAATHVFNGMARFHHRDPGVVGAVLDRPAVSCELICDGFHVAPAAMRLLYRAKGPPGIRLVTDAIAAAGMPDGEYRLGARPVTVTGGQARLTGGEAIAGSTLTMESAVQNAVRFLRIPVPEAVLMASTNAARLLGLERRKGAITPGLDADLVVLDDRLSVEAVMVGGRWLLGPP